MNSSVNRSYAYCTRLARARAGNFYYAFLVLPRPEQQAMCALYSFLRLADDLADEPSPTEQKQRDLASWREQLDGALRGIPRHPLHPALVDTVKRFGLEPAHLHGLLDGVEQDLTTTAIATFEELYRYCYRVASLVGLSCIRIWRCRDPQADALAEASGIAFQLTNILRDAAEDARMGRTYLPREDLDRYQCDAVQLRSGPFDDRYRALMHFELERARKYYDQAAPLTELLTSPGRAVFQVMTQTYRGLLDELEQRGFDHCNGPVRLSRWRKLGFLLGAVPVRLGWT
jgi:phytoene synthase